MILPPRSTILARKLEGAGSLAELGVREADLDHVAEIAMRSPYFNPRPLTKPLSGRCCK